MDTSKTYKKMCDHPKIQEQWKIKTGDYAYDMGDVIIVGWSIPLDSKPKGWKVKTLNSNHSIGNVYLNCFYDKQMHPLFTWLPLQGQIQKMCLEFPSMKGRVMKPLWELLDQFGYFAWENKVGLESCSDSLEQLWLAFYMHEKHGLIWDGEKWEKENK